ncbi:hypothetical protein GCM10011344_27520 [Dokdonia pacifica]|uniref:Pentapeptide repeat-containing protein n=1 Tax=Dokdonia pacifica TaxID=1627892 RepID=A0A239CGA4_9FLAO|nr:pentapeptide repeat-containing protein [Dokdonia pacifica]GGG25336.1 hypothetical protein GCM10011344_27520 [Dokdonia pacifica]SNS18721.1 hypothetical protein SAMN06265376_107293 [Dokdonia pacifica]
MCNYTIPVNNYKPNDLIKFCNYYELINSNTEKSLDILDSDGKCIFHSNHIKWKRENDFYRFLFILIEIYLIKKEEVDLNGVCFISKTENTSISYLQDLFPCNLHGAVFWEDIDMHNQIISYEVNLEYCNFKSDVFFENCTFESRVIFSNIDFRCETSGTFEFKGCKFNASVDFCNNRIQGSLSIQDCHFLEQFIFLDNRLLDDGLFEVTSTFEDYTIFGNLDITSTLVNFCDCHFNGETVFSNNKIQPEQQFILGPLTVKRTLLFSGKDNNRIFHGYTRFQIDLERIEGKITFQNVNLSNIDEKDRREIIQLQSTGKIIIERGCIKYRLQTPEKKIDIKENNQALIDEITRTYSNFFTVHTGWNLGVEVVERNSNIFTFFYFSDENISEDFFFDLLTSTSKELLSGFINFENYLNKSKGKSYFINGLNGIISLMTISFRASMLIAIGEWKQKDTNALINSINPIGNSLSTEDFHQKLSEINVQQNIQKLITNNKLNFINIHQVNQNGDKSIYIEKNINTSDT